MRIPELDRYPACLLGGAVGDALGAPIEFMTRERILARFGPDGLTGYAPAYGGIGTITDDTQMTLFTAEGLLRAWVRGAKRGVSSYDGVVAHAYQRWLRTQGASNAHLARFSGDEGWLFAQRALHATRAPGNTCLSALRSMPSYGEPARNSSKGCGGVMRMAPVGLYFARSPVDDPVEEAFAVGNSLAALTHGHPSGVLPAGAFAVIVLVLAQGGTLDDAIECAKSRLLREPDHSETLDAIESAERLARRGGERHAALARLGQGWVAEEALAIALYCAQVAEDFRDGVLLAVNHDGDSDSTGALAGHLLGAMHGMQALPAEWLDPLELRDVVDEVARDLYAYPGWRIGESEGALDNARILAKYPPN